MEMGLTQAKWSQVCTILFSCLLLFVSSLPSNGTETCYAALDIVQVQDMTSSFDYVWEMMAGQVGSILNETLRHEESQFGFATFGDKPLSRTCSEKEVNCIGHDLGYPSDYCFNVDLELGRPNISDVQTLFKTYSDMASGGGGDWLENVYGGIYRASVSKKLKWREVDNKGNKVLRVIVVVTDALPHVAGDVDQLVKLKVKPFNLSTKILSADDYDENAFCAEMEYPSLEDVVEELKRTETKLIILAAPAGEFSNTTFRPFSGMANMGRDYCSPNGLSMWYKHQLREKNFKAVFVETLDPSMTVYSTAFKEALNQFDQWRCPTSSTTTTSTATTSTATTSTATTSTATTSTATTSTATTSTATTSTATTSTATSTVLASHDQALDPGSYNESELTLDLRMGTEETPERVGTEETLERVGTQSTSLPAQSKPQQPLSPSEHQHIHPAQSKPQQPLSPSEHQHIHPAQSKPQQPLSPSEHQHIHPAQSKSQQPFSPSQHQHTNPAESKPQQPLSPSEHQHTHPAQSKPQQPLSPSEHHTQPAQSKPQQPLSPSEHQYTHPAQSEVQSTHPAQSEVQYTHPEESQDTPQMFNGTEQSNTGFTHKRVAVIDNRSVSNAFDGDDNYIENTDCDTTVNKYGYADDCSTTDENCEYDECNTRDADYDEDCNTIKTVNNDGERRNRSDNRPCNCGKGSIPCRPNINVVVKVNIN